MNDNEIIELFWNRSEDAIGQLDEKYGKLARSVAMNILHDTHDTDECMNDSYLGMWNSLPPHRPPFLSAFFVSLTRNTALKLFRYHNAQKRHALIEELDDLCGSIPSPEEEICGIGVIISEFMKSLDSDSRMLFLLRYYIGEDIATISKALGITESNAKVKLLRMRKKLREKLEKEGITI